MATWQLDQYLRSLSTAFTKPTTVAGIGPGTWNRNALADSQDAHAAILADKATAESIRIRASALEANAKLVEWEAVQKWDGKLPVYQMGGAMPFIQLPAR